jgi:hypothetical protein
MKGRYVHTSTIKRTVWVREVKSGWGQSFEYHIELFEDRDGFGIS